MEKEILTSRNKKNTEFPCGRSKGENYDREYLGVHSHTGVYHQSLWKMFRTREDAIETLSEQERGGMSL